MKLFEPYTFCGRQLKSRIVMPPMVTFWLNHPDGCASPEVVEHYAQRAQSGAGLIIVEALCVSPTGRLHETQMGLWDDAFIDGQAKIVQAVQQANSLALAQIHHAGIMSVGGERLAPSGGTFERKGVTLEAEELTKGDIADIQQQFLEACIRAVKAGYDGVELHGCHGYLISQFHSEYLNRRTDAYGGSITNRMRFGMEIYEEVRHALGSDAIIGMRLSCMEENFNEGIAMAKAYAGAGMDFLDISNGFHSGAYLPDTPEGFVYDPRVYGAWQIKQQVDVPVIAVYGLNTGDKADGVLQSGYADLIATGRQMLIEPDWAGKVQRGESFAQCIMCRRCGWNDVQVKCPVLK